MRNHHLEFKAKEGSGKGHAPTKGKKKRSSTAVSVEECAKTVVFAADRRMRKVYFPLKPYIAVYLRPFLPDLIDKQFKKHSSM